MILWIALAVLGLLLLISLTQRYFAGQITTGVSRSLAGDLALLLAQSCLDEAVVQVGAKVNDPESPLFRQFREPVAPPNKGSFNLGSAIALVEAAKLVKSSTFGAFSYSGPNVEVLFQRPFEGIPSERLGLLHYTVRVSGSVGSSGKVVRELHAYQEFKTVLITTPRPFDRPPLYIQRFATLTDQVKANQLRQRVLDLYAKSRDALARAAALAPAGKIANAYVQMLDEAKAASDVSRSTPELPVEPDAHVTASWIPGQGYPLEGLDLAQKLQDLLPKLQEAVAHQARDLSAVLASPSSEANHRTFIGTSSETLTSILTCTVRMWAYSHMIQFVPVSAQSYKEMDQAAAAFLSYEHIRRKAFFVLREDPRGGTTGSIQSQFEHLLKNVNTPAGGAQDFNGIIMVENHHQPLTLRGDIHGKLIIAATRGGLILENTNAHVSGNESLVAMTFGGPLDVSGTVNAVLVAAPLKVGDKEYKASLHLHGGTTVNGGLFVPGPLASVDWKGFLNLDDRYFSGARSNTALGWYEHYYVGLSPRISFQTLARK